MRWRTAARLLAPQHGVMRDGDVGGGIGTSRALRRDCLCSCPCPQASHRPLPAATGHRPRRLPGARSALLAEYDVCCAGSWAPRCACSLGCSQAQLDILKLEILKLDM